MYYRILGLSPLSNITLEKLIMSKYNVKNKVSNWLIKLSNFNIMEVCVYACVFVCACMNGLVYTS